jgi:hypothetical protein
VNVADRTAAKAKADAAHEKYVIRTYGLVPGQYAQMLADQDGRCALCMRIPRRRRLAVDHDHNTGMPRALLCYLCNKYLGQWEGDPLAAHNAGVYLLAISEAYGDLRDPDRPAPLLN